MTLIMPVSSSRLRKVTPEAVAGRCLFLAGHPPDEGVDGAALDRAGADERDLAGQVVEAARPQPGRVAIWARDSTWKTPTESARQSWS
ncbi:hypothetical protein EV644_12479 [Kribbella orskensis]|uniref:Uncharacterized protein n=1 Tax=Kribbella orskensis TaxID=2512216 RepID=A0ABY2BBZ1_9ACTN|nr:hypothetical protein EV644_12479 [Kribbella orskensis]